MSDAVLRQELLVAGRRHRSHVLRWGYAAILLVQLLPRLLYAAGFGERIGVGAAAPYRGFFESFVAQHFVFLLLVTPALAAGALTDEKVRGTLGYLLTTALRPLDIVLGKLASRAYQVVLLSLVGVPLVCFFGASGDLDASFPVVLILASAALVLGVVGLSLLASAWCKQTRDAMLLAYFVVLGGWYASGWAAATPAGGALAIFSPWRVMAEAAPLSRWARLGPFVLAWLAVAGACTAVAAWRLRPAYLRQLRATGRRPRRWWRASYSDPEGNPVAWRESQVQGLAPLPWLRALPRWVGLTALGIFAVAALALLIWDQLPADIDLVDALLAGGIPAVREAATTLSGHTFLVFTAVGNGTTLLLILTLLVAVRASGCISDERERGTWDGVLLTPLTTREIVRGKFKGVLWACLPYVLVYTLVTAPLYGLFSPWALMIHLLTAGFVVTAVLWVAAVGVCCSAYTAGSWRSLFTTLGIGYAAYLFLGIPLWGMSMFISCIAMIFVAIAAAILQAFNINPDQMPDEVKALVLGTAYGLPPLLLMFAVVGALGYALLTMAEGRIDVTERTRYRRRPRAGDYE